MHLLHISCSREIITGNQPRRVRGSQRKRRDCIPLISQHFSRIYQEARQRLAVSNCIMYGRHLPFDLTTRISEFSISKSHHEVYCNAFHSSGYFFILFLILSCVPRKKVWFSRVAIFYFSVIAYIRALCLFQFFLVVVVIMSLRRAKGTEQCA